MDVKAAESPLVVLGMVAVVGHPERMSDVGRADDTSYEDLRALAVRVLSTHVCSSTGACRGCDRELAVTYPCPPWRLADAVMGTLGVEGNPWEQRDGQLPDP